MIAAAMSTSLLAFITLRYGNPTMRFCGVTVAICSGVIAAGDQAYGLVAATALKRDHSRAISATCSSGRVPAAALIADSNNG